MENPACPLFGQKIMNGRGDFSSLTLAALRYWRAAILHQGTKMFLSIPDIKLAFSNNVIAPKVRAHNMQCFYLENSKKQYIEIDVIMADPNDNSEKKKEIIIHPQNSLQANTVYVLTISESLTASNQKMLGVDKIISFTTDNANISCIEKQDGIFIV